ncbi:hypothetical protein TNCV_46151 [Trichonephila clavipes]|nr:hypothetical protein TNCV_46151 [Trichonephila clavipes]
MLESRFAVKRERAPRGFGDAPRAGNFEPLLSPTWTTPELVPPHNYYHTNGRISPDERSSHRWYRRRRVFSGAGPRTRDTSHGPGYLYHPHAFSGHIPLITLTQKRMAIRKAIWRANLVVSNHDPGVEDDSRAAPLLNLLNCMPMGDLEAFDKFKCLLHRNFMISKSSQ